MLRPPRKTCSFVLLAACLFAAGASFAAEAEDSWPQFRGPRGDGHSTATGIASVWAEDKNVAWKIPVPGEGHSSPVVADGRIWLTAAVVSPLSAEEQKARLAKIPNANGLEIAGKVTLKALAYDAQTGSPLFDAPLFQLDEPPAIHSLNSYASPSPVLEDGKLYCHFGTFGNACVDAATGKVLWKNDEHQVDHQNGPGSSPILWGRLFIVHYDGIDKQYLVALHKESGKTAWKVARSGKLEDKVDLKKAYCTPTIIEENGKPVLVSPGADWVYGYDPESGEELWKLNYGKLGFSTVPKPIQGNGLVYICTSYMESRLLAIRTDGRGDVSKSHVAWTVDKQVPRKPSLILVGEQLYMVNDGGVLTCMDASTGKTLWVKRLGGDFSASPTFVDGKLYFLNQQGKAWVLRPGDRYDEIAENTLSEGFMASPAIHKKALLLRTTGHLYRIEEPAK